MASRKHNRAAVLDAPHARIALTSRPIPTPGANEVLVHNHAIASNPVDWKMQDYNLFISNYPIVLGSDVSGTVSAVGASVTDISPGDRVCGFAAVICNSNIDHGAFQDYTILYDYATLRLPPTVSFEQGAVLPMAVVTAALGLFVNLGIPTPNSPSWAHSVDTGTAILVWGGASSVGTLVIQMGKKLGLTVIATASPKHHTYLKSLGADLVYDYTSSEVIKDILHDVKESGVRITYAYDCVSAGDTFSQCSELLADKVSNHKKHGDQRKLALVLPWPEGLTKPNDVEVSPVAAMDLVGQRIDLSRWLFREWLPSALADESIVPSPPIEIVEGGLENTQGMLDRHKAGVSGKKLVLQVS